MDWHRAMHFTRPSDPFRESDYCGAAFIYGLFLFAIVWVAC
jgi:hypothetical protein